MNVGPDDAVATLIDGAPPSAWVLVGQLSPNGPVHQIALPATKIRVGRRPDCELFIPNQGVSAIHAELTSQDGELEVRDLGSTNGTYVNGEMVYDRATVRADDVIQFANVALLVHQDSAHERPTLRTRDNTRIRALAQLDQLINHNGLVPHFQPIVCIDSGEPLGYEVLARSKIPGLTSPQEMFQTAAQLGLSDALSRVARSEGRRHAAMLPASVAVYLNTHPSELSGEPLDKLLSELRANRPDRPLVLEVHEASITSRGEMRQLRDALDALDIRLAYDDFGAGQSRLNDLTEVPPDIVKFDMILIRDIDSAPRSRQRMIASLVKMVLDLGITPVAEGIETAEEAKTCRELGFQMAQGFHYGRPMLVDSLPVETQRIEVERVTT